MVDIDALPAIDHAIGVVALMGLPDQVHRDQDKRCQVWNRGLGTVPPTQEAECQMQAVDARLLQVTPLPPVESLQALRELRHGARCGKRAVANRFLLRLGWLMSQVEQNLAAVHRNGRLFRYLRRVGRRLGW